MGFQQPKYIVIYLGVGANFREIGTHQGEVVFIVQ